MKDYQFQVDVFDVSGQLAICKGRIRGKIGDLSLYNEVLEQVFLQLTEGRAVYDHPGVGCTGPYTLKKIVIEED